MESHLVNPGSILPPSDILRLLNQAVAFHQKGHLADAERLYAQILKAQPSHFDARHLLGVLRDQQGRHTEARELISSALETKPDATYALFNYAIVLKKLYRFEEALKIYERLLLLDPRNIDALNSRGLVLSTLRRYEEALAHYDRALAIKPDRVQVFRNRGNALRNMNRYEEALASYDKALAIKPDFSNALTNRGAILQLLKRYEDAITSFDRALTVEPDNSETLYKRGNVLFALERYDQAVASYDQALRLKPDYDDAHHGRGASLKHLGNYSEAINSYDRALAIRGISILAPSTVDVSRNVGSSGSQCAEERELLVEWRPLEALGAIEAEWKALVGRALDPHIFYEPAFAMPASVVYGSGVQAALVKLRAPPQRLVGLFPARIEHFGGRSALVGWRGAPLGTPLVDRDFAEDVINAFLDNVYGTPRLPQFLMLPHVPTVGRFASLVSRVVVRRGGQVVMIDPHQRAQFAPGSERYSYLERAIGSKRRQNNLRRARQHLEKIGRVTFTTATTTPAIVKALSDFFTLEASGWKGRLGSAAANTSEFRRFLESAVIGLAAEGKARVDRLLLDDRAIAASITFQSGHEAWFWKTAYDEDLAKESPGVQLLLYLTRELLAEPTIIRADGCAVRDSPLVNHMWRERLSIAHFAFTAGPKANTDFEFRCRDLALRFCERR
jgi:tetratricopeptide (TPR) repeat protein/CelD/BcsL family acetyltransferase involved in cellulose biosynthesis